eukprot:TRINITY_DN1604_c0_g1_i4.p2 TRINITY_DN1604_c0_g1~~TRINITY_DN1604_c0_g1_i4.p2  ORF type:complete len:160 (+),score=25.32 TRINITY_DN1604_c0_g1_i4:1140-1619(+)
MSRTKAQIIIPRAADFPYPERVIQIKGTRDQVDAAKREIEAIIGIPLMKANPMFLPDPKRFPMCMPPFCILRANHRLCQAPEGDEGGGDDEERHAHDVLPAVLRPAVHAFAAVRRGRPRQEAQKALQTLAVPKQGQEAQAKQAWRQGEEWERGEEQEQE